MKSIILSMTLLLSLQSLARIMEEYMPEIMFEGTERDKALSPNEAAFEFRFQSIWDGTNPVTIQYSIDGKSRSKKLSGKPELEIRTTPGKHVFQFYYNDLYYEVYSDSLEIKPGYRSFYSVYFSYAEYPTVTEKPVIYLYPEKQTDVLFKMNIKGKNVFTYPELGNGWQFTADPDGTLTFGDDQFRYLFWDAEQFTSIPSSKEVEGFVVKGSEATTFLEEKLTEARLNSAERADFITYWGPRLASKEKSFVRFVFNTDCDQFATFDIAPKPKNIYRIYMIWHEMPGDMIVKEQKIEKFDREGFCILEWGGQQLKISRLRRDNIELMK